MKIYNEPIPKTKIFAFHEILCTTGGRYLCNPCFNVYEDQYRVCYKPGDYTRMCEMLNRASIEIVEKRSDQKWRRILRRFKVPFV